MLGNIIDIFIINVFFRYKIDNLILPISILSKISCVTNSHQNRAITHITHVIVVAEVFNSLRKVSISKFYYDRLTSEFVCIL
jgi:hypothetical protein